MKRYLVLQYDTDEYQLDWNDRLGLYNTLEESKSLVEEGVHTCTYNTLPLSNLVIIDLETEKMILQSLVEFVGERPGDWFTNRTIAQVRSSWIEITDEEMKRRGWVRE